jgi:prepilin-type processing-associated H-X9-DG protein
MRLRLLLAFGIVAVMSVPVPARQEAPESPAVQTVQAFLAALEKGEIAKASALVAKTKPDVVDSRIQGIVPTGSRLVMSASRVYGNESETIVVAEIEVTAPDRPSYKLTDTFRLRKDGDTWKILADPINAQSGPPPSIVAMLLADPNVTQQAKSASKRTVCLSNVKQLALGTIMYAGDNDDRLPDASHWRSAVMPYVKNAEIFRCPADTSGAASSYRLNPRLSRLPMTAVGEPANTAMIYEGDGNGFTPRHNGMGSVSFVDGHAKVVSATLYGQIRQAP